MSTSDDKPTGSFFDAIRDRRRIVSVQATRGIPPGLHLAAAYAWRFLVIAAAVGVGIWLVIQLKLLVIPLLIAILLTALVWPAFTGMLRLRFPRWLAIAIAVLGTAAIVTGLLWLAIWQIMHKEEQAFEEFYQEYYQISVCHAAWLERWLHFRRKRHYLRFSACRWRLFLWKSIVFFCVCV